MSTSKRVATPDNDIFSSCSLFAEINLHLRNNNNNKLRKLTFRVSSGILTSLTRLPMGAVTTFRYTASGSYDFGTRG